MAPQTNAAPGRGQPVQWFYWAVLASLFIAGYFLAFFLSAVNRTWMDYLAELSMRWGWYTTDTSGPGAMGYWGPISPLEEP